MLLFPAILTTNFWCLIRYIYVLYFYGSYFGFIYIGEIAVTSTNQDLIAASCYAIGEIARKSALPLPNGGLGWFFYFLLSLEQNKSFMFKNTWFH